MTADPSPPREDGPDEAVAFAYSPTFDPATAPDEALVDAAVSCQVAQNRANARQWASILTYHDRCVAEMAARPGPPPGTGLSPRITPLKATKAEFCPALGIHELSVQIRLDELDLLRSTFPGIWARCLSGRLDLGKATLVVEQVRHLADDEEVARYAAEVEAWFDDRDPTDGVEGDEDTDPYAAALCALTRQQVQRAVYYRRLKRRQRDPETRFRQAFEKRAVRLRETEAGMALLTANTALPTATAADYRLTLIAKKLSEAPGETRTLDQLRCDALLDLINGRVTVAATNRQLEDDAVAAEDEAGCDGDGGPEGGAGPDVAELIERHRTIGAFARPVVNVTVPVETLMGVSDEPGVLSGGRAIPADLARQIAADPDSTWYRLLTDARREAVELSTERYEPSPPIWREVVARDQHCAYPGCDRPAVRSELDHTVPWPEGATRTGNLAPLCTLHHQVKHSEGFRMRRLEDGRLEFTTRTGRRYRVRPERQPRPSTGDRADPGDADRDWPIAG